MLTSLCKTLCGKIESDKTIIAFHLMEAFSAVTSVSEVEEKYENHYHYLANFIYVGAIQFESFIS